MNERVYCALPTSTLLTVAFPANKPDYALVDWLLFPANFVVKKSRLGFGAFETRFCDV